MKEWVKPELVVMQRGTAGEAVLTACKNDFGETTEYTGAGTTQYGCLRLQLPTFCMDYECSWHELS